ncbi:MAG TPA: hypothetical protein VI168_17525 [Croceibacterium sp.]
MRSTIISAIVAGGLLITTTAAGARQPAPLPRSGAAVEDADQIAGTFMIIGLLAVLAVVGIFVLLDDDDEPTSP